MRQAGWSGIVLGRALPKRKRFNVLALTVKVASLRQITDALFNVGGQYRRNM
jgi:hypothetical protein